MTRLVNSLAAIIREKVHQVMAQRAGTKMESRILFHGPPLELLELVYGELTKEGIVTQAASGEQAVLPVLLQVPSGQPGFTNPAIGMSGPCDETHLLDLRNVPACPSFVALVPPGQHSNMSVSSTTDEFGISAANNATHATFDEWWGDEFVQRLVASGLSMAGFRDDLLNEARGVVEDAARAMDEVDLDRRGRKAAWRLLARIFSILGAPSGLTRSQALSLACGVPPMQDESVSAKIQLDILQNIADALADGFKAGVDRARQNAKEGDQKHLDEFLAHIQGNCKIPTAFERAIPAFYLPADGWNVDSPPGWWTALTVEKWSELLAEEPEEINHLIVECTNPIFPPRRGVPTLVRDQAELAISTGVETQDGPVDVLVERGTKYSATITVNGTARHVEQLPKHKTPVTYKVSSARHKKTSVKVISLSTWFPGIIVLCRTALKVAPVKSSPRKTARGKYDWETALTVPGAGRYELSIFLAPGINVGEKATGIQDDATEADGETKCHTIQSVRGDEYLVEVEAEGKYQLDIPFSRMEQGEIKNETCRVYVSCEEVSEEGCRSEFERLILLNRRQLEKFDAKPVVQLDRNGRSSSLQSWMLDEQYVSTSFRPLVLSEDYASHWATPNWEDPAGPILSAGSFLHDPRPSNNDFQPPKDFVSSREKIATMVRETDDHSGLLESAPLGRWLARDQSFNELVESYLASYMAWLGSDPDTACWVDVVAVTSLEQDGRTLARVPDAILLSPLHPLRLAWHCLAQRVLHEAIEGNDPCPCPAGSIIDPGCVPDIITLSLQAPGGIETVDYLSVECNSDYWSVLWNGSRLRQLSERATRAPFDGAFGITIGGISSGFSAAQVSRALDDVSNLLAAKPIVSVVVSGAGGTTDACNEGLVTWCTNRFGSNEKVLTRQNVGQRMVQVYDTRPESSRPDDATIANLSEETGNKVRWFEKQPAGAVPDLGVIAQLDSSEPETTSQTLRSPLGIGGLIRHRVRRQLAGPTRAFLGESRQGLRMAPSGDVLADKVASCIVTMENRREGVVGLRFAPNVHAVRHSLEGQKADFVAVSSSAIDPACFLGGWLQGAYLWDYDLPSYSHRAGDTNGYYLLSKIKTSDRDSLRRVLSRLPGCEQLDDQEIELILLEVARRGIPTVRGLSGDDTGATGDLGLFLAVRLLQDQFRTAGNLASLLPVIGGTPEDVLIAIVVPVDPFRGYLGDLAKTIGRDRRNVSLSRPDLLVVTIRLTEETTRIHLTPIEVKYRQGSILNSSETADALGQARSLSLLLSSLAVQSQKSLAWRLSFQHLLLSMIGFGLRVYSQHNDVSGHAGKWSEYHERIAAAILGPTPVVTVDPAGRLVVVDDSTRSGSFDRDDDGMEETIVIAAKDAGRIVAGDAQTFYDAVRGKVGDWSLLPPQVRVSPSSVDVPEPLVPVVTTANEKVDGEGAVQKADVVEEVKVPVKETLREDGANQEDEGTGILLSVGSTTDGFESRMLALNISDTRLNQLNMGVVGDLGTGKTQLLKSLIFQITRARASNRGIAPRFLIFDYKRDYSSPDFVEATGARVVKPTRLPLNLFDTSSMSDSPVPWLDRFRFFADVLDKIYSGIGPVQRDKLKNAVRNAYAMCGAEGRQPTIYDIHAAYRHLLAGKSDAPMAIIDDLVDMEVFSRDPEETLPFDKFFDGIVVVSLDAMGQDDRSKNMLVAVMLNMFYENMLKIPKRPFKGTSPQLRVIDSYLLVDEADNIMRYEFDVLRKLLLQGREFGAGVILASQYLRHFKVNATDYREPLLTWFIHKVPNVNASELGALGFTSDLAELGERVKTLSNHHCLFKSFDIPGEVIKGLPFYELKQES